jgi:15-cis-phytoene synthase
MGWCRMPPEDTHAADLEACRVLMRGGSKTFSAASHLMPARVRGPATALYAFCRIADDEIDACPDATEATVDALRVRLDHVYAGTPADSPIDRALSAVVRAHHIPRALPDALLEGLAWDARGRRYETLEELYAYAARVAGAVGAMMTVLMGSRETAVLARACDLGVAMQLTNIARDVGEDAQRGRLYLPSAWMREAGVDPDAWLARPVPQAEVALVVERLLAAADTLYRRADEGIARLPRDCRVAIFAARLIYSDIGRYVLRAGLRALTVRAYVPAWRKVWLLVRSSFGARRLRAAEPSLPPLGSKRFLVSAVSACADVT